MTDLQPETETKTETESETHTEKETTIKSPTLNSTKKWFTHQKDNDIYSTEEAMSILKER